MILRTRNSSLKWTIVAGSVLSLLGPSAIIAQENTGGLEEIIVIARKVEEPLQETPLAVTALSGARMRAESIVTLDDVKGIPNFSVVGVGLAQGQARLAIRGVSFTNTDPFQAPAIALSVDGVYYDSMTSAILNVFDLESLEVLRGPQGTLFGANSPGGVINVKSRRPSGVFDFNAEATIGNYSRTDVRLGMDIPLVSDKLNARVALLKRDSSDSPYENLAVTPVRFDPSVAPLSLLQSQLRDELEPDRRDVLLGRVVLDFTPTEALSFTLIHESLDDESTVVPLKGTSDDTVPAGMLTPPGLPGGDDPFIGVNDFTTYGPLETQVASLTIEYDLTDSLTLTSITAQRDEERLNVFDVDGEFGAFLHSPQLWEQEQSTQELRLHSNLDGRFNFVVGGLYMDATLEKIQESQLSRDGLCLAIFGTVNPGPPPAGGCPIGGFAPDGMGGFVGPFANSAYNFTSVRQDTINSALFAQLYFDLTDQMRLTLGGRYTKDEKDFVVDVRLGNDAIGFDPGVSPPTPGAIEVDESNDWSNFSPMVSIDYQWSDDVMLYASYREAFRAGGYPGRATTVVSFREPFDEELLSAVELGVKSTLANGRVRLNAAYFYSKYDDLQRELQVLVPTGPENLIVNAAEATIQGLEVEMTALLSENLTLRSSAGYLDAEYDEFNPILRADQVLIENISALATLPLPLAPEWTAMLGLNYHLPLANNSSLTLELNGTYTSEQILETDPAENGALTRDSVSLLNAFVSWKSPSQVWNVKLWSRNLSDERYLQNGATGAGIVTATQVSEPRTYGLTVGYAFE